MFFFTPNLLSQLPNIPNWDSPDEIPAIIQLTPEPQLIVEPQEIRTLSGQLDTIPVFNSNSPEVVQTDGILLSLFPPTNKTDPTAHLNYPLSGRFDIFTHHIARKPNSTDSRPIYQGILILNPRSQPVTIYVLQGLTYSTNPDAPFIDLPSVVENPFGEVYSGPGSRLVTDILRNINQSQFPREIVIEPGESYLLLNEPIVLGSARSTYFKLSSTLPVYVANLALTAPFDSNNGSEVNYRPPTVEEWKSVLVHGTLVQPRDLIPTPPDQRTGHIIYGRVAGVSMGSQWTTTVKDNNNRLNIPNRGKAYSYPLSTIPEVSLGTGQVQSAPLAVRYPDTAYSAHGNYLVRYRLKFPFYNPTNEPKTITLSLQTPLKKDDTQQGLDFLSPPDSQVFYRGTIKLSYLDENRVLRSLSYHIVQRRGEQGQPLLTLTLNPQETREAEIELLYPPDATPPQVITVKTLP